MSTSSVLIVDDDPDFMEITRTVLEAKDYRVRSAYNGDEALVCLEEEKPVGPEVLVETIERLLASKFAD